MEFHRRFLAEVLATRVRLQRSKRIAAHNTFMTLTAEDRLYSHVPDFHWPDEVLGGF
jgi:hypothetical protein